MAFCEEQKQSFIFFETIFVSLCRSMSFGFVLGLKLLIISFLLRIMLFFMVNQ